MVPKILWDNSANVLNEITFGMLDAGHESMRNTVSLTK